jgi:hypothetical protein
LNYQNPKYPANSPSKTSLFSTSHIYKNPMVFSRKSTAKSTLHTTCDLLKPKTLPSLEAIAISTTMANHIFPLFISPLIGIMSMSLIMSQTILVEARQLLEVTLPELPKPEFPELPKPELPKLPEFPIPELPKFEIPKLPELPKPEFPELPKPELPKLPEFPKPELPKFEIPKLPELPPFPHFPDLTKSTLPTIPSHSTTSP